MLESLEVNPTHDLARHNTPEHGAGSPRLHARVGYEVGSPATSRDETAWSALKPAEPSAQHRGANTPIIPEGKA
ncbi:hypothetical protein QE368_000926 [Asaia bogorensis NBRC 16594]|nr:hypothetical protein [Asaia bogorensis NBRC 16594]